MPDPKNFLKLEGIIKPGKKCAGAKKLTTLYTGEIMIFLDTSFLVAFEVDTDSNHENASAVRVRIVKNEFGPALISDYIFDEAVTAVINMKIKMRDCL